LSPLRPVGVRFLEMNHLYKLQVVQHFYDKKNHDKICNACGVMY
jgi:hypothetical protein